MPNFLHLPAAIIIHRFQKTILSNDIQCGIYIINGRSERRLWNELSCYLKWLKRLWSMNDSSLSVHTYTSTFIYSITPIWFIHYIQYSNTTSKSHYFQPTKSWCCLTSRWLGIWTQSWPLNQHTNFLRKKN
jgi:hypothetical protein